MRTASALLAEAFADDPGWVAIGPRWRAHRRRSNRVAFAGILAASERGGARIRFARGEASARPLGVTIAFEPGRWPLTAAPIAWGLAWALAAGPLPVRRALRDDLVMRAGHVTHPHMYLWFLAVEPAAHGRGIGRALLAELHGRSAELAVPTFLETGSEANVGFYERLGYEVIGELAMPSGTMQWKMERPAAAIRG